MLKIKILLFLVFTLILCSAFGNTLTIYANPFGYGSYQYEGNGLYYLNVRYLKEIGLAALFLEKDTYSDQKKAMFDGVFNYAGDDPINQSDPSGFSEENGFKAMLKALVGIDNSKKKEEAAVSLLDNPEVAEALSEDGDDGKMREFVSNSDEFPADTRPLTKKNIVETTIAKMQGNPKGPYVAGNYKDVIDQSVKAMKKIKDEGHAVYYADVVSDMRLYSNQFAYMQRVNEDILRCGPIIVVKYTATLASPLPLPWPSPSIRELHFRSYYHYHQEDNSNAIFFNVDENPLALDLKDENDILKKIYDLSGQ